jgi:type VI secretion system protein ImpH
MAGARGQESIAVAGTLREQPWPVGFFQSVRLLQLASGGDPVGRYGPPAKEAVRFGADTRMAFPASEVQSIDAAPNGPPVMRVNIMGLTGPLGVLPLAYTALLRERQRAGDLAGRDFLDIFHHRLLSLFYLAWEKYRFGVSFERGERDRLSHHLADLIGLGTPGLENRQDVPDVALLFYAGLLGMQTRPAAALEQILNDYFGVAAEIEQFIGAWRPIDPADQCSLGEDFGPSERLGMGALAGAEIWDDQTRIRIRLGPLSLEEYRGFLPGGAANRRLRALAAFYAGMEFDIDVELILRRDEVPECELGDGPQLGWTTWAKSAPFSRDPGDTILEFEQAA